MRIVTAYAVQRGAIARVDHALSEWVAYCVLLGMAAFAEFHDIRFQKRAGFGGMWIMAQLTPAFRYGLVHDHQIILFREIGMAFDT